MWLKNFATDFKPQKVGLRKILGDLETDVMEIVWKKDKITVRDVYEILRAERQIAYTTVMTIMGRLAGKGILLKDTLGNTHIYRPALSKKEFTQYVINEVLDGLFEDFTEPALNHFVDRLSKENNEKLNQLEDIIKTKRNK